MDYRLPTTVVPKRYDLRLEPDLGAATFSGEAVITVDVETTLTEIVLNAAELQIQSASVARGAVCPSTAPSPWTRRPSAPGSFSPRRSRRGSGG